MSLPYDEADTTAQMVNDAVAAAAAMHLSTRADWWDD